METFLIDNDKRHCTGCSACKMICPKNAIELVEDEEGFKYPFINQNLCIDCKLCEKVCPLKAKLPDQDTKEVYALINDNEDVLLKSASGGAFTVIVDAFCTENYLIFGVELDEGNKVKFSSVDDKKEITKYRKSKYVQSEMGDCFKQVKSALQNDQKVLFVGTPCQIAGLKSFLAKDYDHLLLVDLICHGVPSQKVFQSYLKNEQKKAHSSITKVDFRTKRKRNSKYDSKNITLEFSNGKKKTKAAIFDSYLRAFQSQLSYRPACGECKFANRNRLGDLTIADCWGIDSLDSTADIHKGISMIVINSVKGNLLFDKIKQNNKVRKLSEDFALKNNSSYSRPAKLHSKRTVFFENLDKMDFDKNVNHCLKTNYFSKIKFFIPHKMKQRVSKLLRKR